MAIYSWFSHFKWWFSIVMWLFTSSNGFYIHGTPQRLKIRHDWACLGRPQIPCYNRSSIPLQKPGPKGFAWLLPQTFKTLVVLTPLKNISQIGSSSQILGKIRNVWNHQPEYSMTPRNLTSTSVLLFFLQSPRYGAFLTLELPNLFVNDLLLSVTFSLSPFSIPSLSRLIFMPPWISQQFPQKMRVKTLGCYLDVTWMFIPPDGKWWVFGPFLRPSRPSRTSIHHHLSYHAAFSLVVHSFRPPVHIVRWSSFLGAGKVQPTPRMSWCKFLFCNWLVVSTYPSEKYLSVGMMIIPNWMENHNPFHGSSHHQSGKRALDMFFYGCFKSSDLHVSFNVWLHHLWYVLIQTDLGVKSLDELFTPIAVVVTQLQRKKLFKQI